MEPNSNTPPVSVTPPIAPVPPAPAPAAIPVSHNPAINQAAGEAMDLNNPAGTPNSVSKTDWAQWVGIGLISLTIVSLILQISLNRKQHMQLGKDDSKFGNDIKELKFNLKNQMGDKYQEMA